MRKFICCVILLFGYSTHAQAQQSDVNAYQFSFDSINGKKLDLSGFKGKLLLVVNTASQCGLTPQYEGLESLYQKYKDRGLVVLGVPANDFGGQEPGSNTEIAQFTQEKYKVTFPLTGKAVVTGNDAHPFYKWAAEQASVIGSPKWNFHKYLIAPDGSFIDWFSSATTPLSDDLTKAIEVNLPK